MAIPIPNFPTDNLYKFMALSGLALLLASILFIEINLSRFDELSNQIEAKQKQVTFLRDLAKTSDNEANINHLEEGIAIIKENEILISQLNVLLNRLSKHLWSMFFLSGLGLSTSIAGFWLWYTRLQKFQDEVLQLNLEKTKLELNKLKPANEAETNE